jgi:hypothetical protein
MNRFFIREQNKKQTNKPAFSYTLIALTKPTPGDVGDPIIPSTKAASRKGE